MMTLAVSLLPFLVLFFSFAAFAAVPVFATASKMATATNAVRKTVVVDEQHPGDGDNDNSQVAVDGPSSASGNRGDFNYGHPGDPAVVRQDFLDLIGAVPLLQEHRSHQHEEEERQLQLGVVSLCHQNCNSNKKQLCLQRCDDIKGRRGLARQVCKYRCIVSGQICVDLCSKLSIFEECSICADYRTPCYAGCEREYANRRFRKRDRKALAILQCQNRECVVGLKTEVRTCLELCGMRPDIITLEQQQQIGEGGGIEHDNGGGSSATKKIVVVSVSLVLIFGAAICLIICCFCRKRQMRGSTGGVIDDKASEEVETKSATSEEGLSDQQQSSSEDEASSSCCDDDKGGGDSCSTPCT